MQQASVRPGHFCTERCQHVLCCFVTACRRMLDRWCRVLQDLSFYRSALTLSCFRHFNISVSLILYQRIVNFIHREKFLCMYFIQQLNLFKWWYWEFGFCASGRPKGLPYIIHYALAHRTAQAVLLWSHSKSALVISLPLGGQLLEQKRQKLQPTPACSDCSERGRGLERERGGMGASFLHSGT